MMRRRAIIYLFLLSITTLNSLLILTPAVALEQSETLIAVEDSTIDLYNPGTNYGGTNDLEVGYFISWLRSYIKFDLSAAPASFHTVELHLEFIWVQATSLIEIYETSNAWGELTITWANAPSTGVLVTSRSIAEDIIYVFDVTDDLESKSGYWSISLTSSDSNWVTLASKQCYSWYEPPRLIYQYTNSNVPIIMGGLAALIIGIPVACGLIFYIYRKRNPKVTSQIAKEAQLVNQPRQHQKPQGIQEDIKYCMRCGHPNLKTLSFCTECGNKF